MVELTDSDRLEIATTLLSDDDLEEYQLACELAEQGMPINDAIEAAAGTGGR